MPIPRPKRDESRAEYLRRAMRDRIMVREFRDPEQRYAVAMKTWRDSHRQGR